MINVKPQIKTHPVQNGTIPTFPRSHSHDAVAVPPQSPATPPRPDLTTAFTHGEIAERAYDLYVRNGRQENQCRRNWEQAENDLRQEGLLACHAEHVIMDVFAPDSIEA